MESVKAIIVDDEQRARRVLKNLLIKDFPSFDIISECAALPEAVEKIEELKPDVVFLDIEMPNYAGYEIVNFFSEIDFEIIFVTAFDSYAIKAFEICAIDYLVKPVDRDKLTLATNKLTQKLQEKDKLQKYEVLLESLKSDRLSKIIIPEIGNRRIFDLKDVLAIEASGAYSKVHLANKTNVLVSKNLKYFENILPDKNAFFRSHRGWIINLQYIRSFNKTTGIIVLEQNIKAKLSRNRFSEFSLAIH